MALVASITNLVHSALRTSGATSALNPAARPSRQNSSARSLVGRSSSPITIDDMAPVVRMMPGSAITAETKAQPGSTARPTIGAKRSALSTPFCSDTTKLSGPRHGRIAAAALSVS
jgi:hypothetical protein